MNNRLITEDFTDTVNNTPLNPVYMNKSTYENMVNLLGYEPTNVVINNFLPDNNAVILENTDSLKYKPYIKLR